MSWHFEEEGRVLSQFDINLPEESTLSQENIPKGGICLGVLDVL